MITVKELRHAMHEWPDDHVIKICKGCGKIGHQAKDLAIKTAMTNYFCSQQCYERNSR